MGEFLRLDDGVFVDDDGTAYKEVRDGVFVNGDKVCISEDVTWKEEGISEDIARVFFRADPELRDAENQRELRIQTAAMILYYIGNCNGKAFDFIFEALVRFSEHSRFCNDQVAGPESGTTDEWISDCISAWLLRYFKMTEQEEINRTGVLHAFGCFLDDCFWAIQDDYLDHVASRFATRPDHRALKATSKKVDRSTTKQRRRQSSKERRRRKPR